MKREDIEKLTFLGASWDPSAEGPIADSRSKIYEAPDGTRYELRDRDSKWRSTLSEPWKDLE